MNDMSDDLLIRSLPKWPQMVVTGKPVTSEQAKDIIRRTDTFFTRGYDGNDHAFNRRVRELLGMAPYWLDEPRPNHPGYSEEARQQWLEDSQRRYRDFEARWTGLVRTSYVHNTWVSCSFIGGPYGWCHPDGVIGYIDNVGKWPDVEDILNDWTSLASTWPFLDIGVTLFSAESCEDTGVPVVSLRILDGKALLVDPSQRDVHEGHPEATRTSHYGMKDTRAAHEVFMERMDHESREQGLPWEWFEEWAKEYGPKKG